MKSNKIILALLAFSMIILIFSGCGGGGSVTPPIPDNTDNIDSEEIEPIEVASGEIDLNEGGVVEVTDPNSELYGLKLTIEPQKNIGENKGTPVINIAIYFALLDICKLPDYQGFLITPFIIKSDFTDALFGKLEIPYYMEQLINSGVAINAPVKVCRVSSSPLPWEELSSDTYTVSNNIVNIPIGLGDFMYYYTLTVNNAAHPNSSGFKSPQPGDLLYKFSKLLPAKINEGWCSGHVGIYVGERYDEEEEKSYNVIEALLGGVTRSYHSPISEFGGDSIYLGAREPEGGLSHQKRNLIIAFAEGVVGTPYATIETVSSMFWTGLGRGELVKGDNGKFNCVGLAEKAYQLVGIDIVSNYDEGNVIHGPYHILTPAEQWYKTIPASGVLVQNTPPKISSLEITPEGSIETNSLVSITCTASDQDGDLLTYIWDKNGGTFEGSTLELPVIKGRSIIWVAPNKEGEYKITCKVIDNYGGEDSKSIAVLVGGSITNHPPNIISSAVTSATKGQLYSYDVNATDSDGDTLVYSLTTKPSGMSINSSTGLITWTPIVAGGFGVTVKVSDGELFDTQSFTVTVEENGATNQPPTLTLVGSGGVSPGSGTPSTTFTYSVYYSDPEGASPTVKNVYVDGSSHTMSGSGSGSTYTFPISGLSAGTHTYSFQFSDGTTTVNLPTSGTYAAPTVTSTLVPPTGLSVSSYWNTVSPGFPSMVLSWNAVSGATGYEMWVRPSGGSYASLGTRDAPYVTFNSNSLPGGARYVSGITYYFKVRTVTASGTSDFTSEVPCVAAASPPPSLGQVQLSSPGNGFTLPPMNITFIWNFVSNATKYEIIIYNSLGQVALDQTTTNIHIIVALSTEETITWKVRAGDNSGNWGAWSSTWSLTIKTLT